MTSMLSVASSIDSPYIKMMTDSSKKKSEENLQSGEFESCNDRKRRESDVPREKLSLHYITQNC